MRDNALNMVNAIANNSQDHAGCFLHTIDLVVMNSMFVQSGIKTMMTISFFLKSPKAMAILR